MTREFKVDREFRSLIPALGSEELEQLEANILSEGCRDSLVVWKEKGILLDGHNRLQICTRHRKKYRVKQLSFPNRDAARLWLISNQMGRRNLADIDRIGLQTHREELLRRLAKKNQGARTDISAKLPKGSPINTRKECAKAAGVGERTYDAGKLILEAEAAGEIDSEVVEKIRRKELSIHKAAREFREAKQAEERTKKRRAAAKRFRRAKVDQLIHADFREKADLIPNESISLIFTDPPYTPEKLHLYRDLSEFAERKLMPGGSVLAYCGAMYLPDVLANLGSHLEYVWTIAVHHSGSRVIRNRKVAQQWKPMLWFSKGPSSHTSIVADVITGSREKEHHDWQQPVSEAAYLIEKLCPTDGVVVDPMIGSGTTAVAAQRLGRLWYGFDIDKEAIATAKARLATV